MSPSKPKRRSPKKQTLSPNPRDISRVLSQLLALYPDGRTVLTHHNPFQLLIAVILSAQCTDDQVNQVTPTLFKRYPTSKKLSQARLPDIEKIIHPCGFFRMKAKSIVGASKILESQFSTRFPTTIEELTTLPGVGRKTASVVMNQAFNLPAIAVDTHVARVSRRLGWTQHQDPVKIEFDLRALLPEKKWTAINGTLIRHGRKLCKARKPLCAECPIEPVCPSDHKTYR